MFPGYLDGGAALLLESLEHLPLGLHDGVGLPGDQEGQALVLGAAHLDLRSGGGLNTRQFLVRVASKTLETLPFFRRNMEYLSDQS